MKRVGLMFVLFLFVAGCDDKGGPVFIALDSDFASFTTWQRFSLGSDPLQGHPPGPRFAYLNHPAPKGAKKYPVGTIIVKTIENPGVPPTSWDIFAMAKRGGNFNSSGAVDWEFFRLKIIGTTPHILTRGITAADPDDGGASYFGQLGNDFVDLCNVCHGTKEANATDSVLSPLLQLTM